MASMIEHPVHKSRPNITVWKWWPVGLTGGTEKGREQIGEGRERRVKGAEEGETLERCNRCPHPFTI